MSRVKILKATAEDNLGLLEFLKDNPSPGLIQIQLDRSPSYFESIKVEGKLNEVMIGKEIETGRILGVGNRSEKFSYINRNEDTIGYLSTLRIDNEYRNSIFLVKAYKFLRDLHKKSKIKFYLTTILKENILARNILTSKRAGLPTYDSIGFYHTHILSKNQRKLKVKKQYTTQIASEKDLPAIVQFLATYGKDKQFFPVYSIEDFSKGNSLLNGILIQDLLIAKEKEEIIGVIGLWKQSFFRKWIVKDYQPILKYSRFLYNIYAKVLRKPILPKSNTEFKYRFLSNVCIKENDSEIFKSMLNTCWDTLQKKTDTDYLVTGFHEKDDLLKVMNLFPSWKIISEAFLVYWEEERQNISILKKGIPYLEVGSL